MNRKTLLCSLLSLYLLSGCSKAEFTKSASDKYPISVSAEIESANHGNLRYAGSIEASVFTENDNIGLFVNNEIKPVKWTYNGSNWIPENVMYWPDAEKSHTFKVFYPYALCSSQTAVPMPSLASQEGDFEHLSKYDFLVSTKVQNLSEGTATVTFADDAAFKHILALVKLTIIGTEDLQEATLTGLCIKGSGIASNSTYSFENESIIFAEKTGDEIALSNLSHRMDKKNKTFYLVVNPKKSDSGKVSLEITYTNRGKNYKAILDSFGENSFVSGTISSANLNIKENQIIISGNEISAWGEGQNLGDIIIGGNENR